MPGLTRQQWLEKYGFSRGKDPFRLEASCAEEDPLLFADDGSVQVEFPYSEEIKGTDLSVGPRFIFSCSGGGKTTFKQNLQREYADRLEHKGANENKLVVTYDDFDLVTYRAGYCKDNLTPRHHTEQIITLILERLLEILEEEEQSDRLECLKHKKTKQLLFRYVKDFGTFHPLQRERLIKSVKGLKQSLSKERDTELIAAFIGLLSGALSPPLLQQTGKFISSILTPKKAENIANVITCRTLLEDTVEICEQFGFESVLILIDNVDDVFFKDVDVSLKNPFYLIKPLASSPRLLRIPGLIFKFFLPMSIHDQCCDAFRLDSFGARVLSWDSDALEKLLNQRLKACVEISEPRLEYSLSELCEHELMLKIDDELIKFAADENSPRALILLCNELLAEHFRTGLREFGDKINLEAWEFARKRAEEVLR